jgi:hypothetical protein
LISRRTVLFRRGQFPQSHESSFERTLEAIDER